MWKGWPIVVLCLAACASTYGDATTPDPGPATDAGTSNDAAKKVGDAGARVDAAAPVACDPSSPFGVPEVVGGLVSDFNLGAIALSQDELTAYFQRATDKNSPFQLATATRPDFAHPFANIVALTTALGTAADVAYSPGLSPDERTLIYGLRLPNGQGFDDTHMSRATRTSTATEFGPGTALGFTVGAWQNEPFITKSALYFVGGQDDNTAHIYRATIANTVIGAPALVAELNSTASETSIVLSADELTAYLGTNRRNGGNDVFVAHRKSANAAFEPPVLVAELSGDDTLEFPNWLSPDNCRIYITRRLTVDASDQIMVASRPQN